MLDTPTAQLNGEYCTPLLGRHQAANASLAIAAAAELGLSRTMIQNGLSECPQPRQRLQWTQRRGVNWLNDAYNANADSVKVALETLAQVPCAGGRYVVLGDMAELGEHTESAHREAGVKASGVVSGLVAIGHWAEVTAGAAREKGVENVEVVAGVKEAVELLRDWLMPGDVILLKASRASKLEQIEELY
jgi:UDP-N-acetylmuramoyl-tripeptide--D-alanyl-D-alanine ligase